ncbi:MAG: hypothetical protein GC200_08280 [Tepidisphaera sp.]|nr:hypothetical protein [Tepidisphaera sp.]
MARATRSIRLAGVSALSLFIFAGHALAQDAAPLSGPAVKDGSVPGEARKLTGGQSADRKEKRDRPLPHPMFMKAFDALKGEGVDKSIALTSDQQDDLDVLNEDFHQSMMKYRQDHMQEVQQLRGELTAQDRKKVDGFLRELGGRPGGKRGERGPGGPGGPEGRRPHGPDGAPPPPPDGENAPPPPPPGDDPMMQDPMNDSKAPTDQAKSENAMGRLREIMEGAPKPADLHAKMIAVLTDAQRPVFDKALAAEQSKWEQEQKDRMAQRFAEKGKGAGKGKGKLGKDILGDGGPITSIDDPRLPEKMRDRLKNLPADQQQKALDRLNARLKGDQPK